MTGPHAKRTPFAYPALAPLWADFAQLTQTPEAADLYVFAHPGDVANAPRALIDDWRVRRRPVVILSEEPFWDTIWGRRPLARHRVLETRFGALPVVQLNHHTSAIFEFNRIPYYLLSDHRFANTYGARFHRNAQITPSEWQARFKARKADLTFMFERRPEPHHNMRWPDGGIIGLCAWRTELALACKRGTIERLGQSWQGGRTRFEIPNWHLDKITRLDNRTRILGAFENTHQPGYITEKLFDAFACGALPLYFAAPDHRVHDLGLPADAWVNLFDLDARTAAIRVDAIRFTPERFRAYAQAQAMLAQLFGTPGNWLAERKRLARALHHELINVLDNAPDDTAGTLANPLVMTPA